MRTKMLFDKGPAGDDDCEFQPLELDKEPSMAEELRGETIHETGAGSKLPEKVVSVLHGDNVNIKDRFEQEKQQERDCQEGTHFYAKELEIMSDIFSQVDFSHNVDYANLEDIINKLTFQKLVEDIEQRCPHWFSLFKMFTKTEETLKIKTASEKLLRLVHANGCLMHIGSQRSSSFPHMIGMLLVSLGCGDGKYEFQKRCECHEI